MAFNPSVDHEGDSADRNTRSLKLESPPDIRRPKNCGQDEIPKDSINDHKKACPPEMVQCGAMIPRNEVGKHNQEKLSEHIQLAQIAQLQSAETNAFPISKWPCFTVLVIVIAILLSSYYNTTTDLNLNQARLLIKELQNNRTQNDEELRAKSHIIQLQNEIKVKETEHLENLTQSESLVKQLQNDIKDLKAKHSEELTKSANCKSGELTQTESKLDHLLSLLKSAYPHISKHDDESLWPLKLFISDEMSDQVAPDAILKMSDFAKERRIKNSGIVSPSMLFSKDIKCV